MSRTDKICQHEDWQREPFRRFLGRHALRNGLGLPTGEPRGELQAEINQGRWIVRCPVAGCGGAIIPSESDPVFYCTECGNEDNGGAMYSVCFPQERKAIEVELMRRPLRARLPSSRNWQPGETVADLRHEADERGVR